MVNGNRPPARIENDRSPDGKLKSHLEWPYPWLVVLVSYRKFQIIIVSK